MISRVPGYGHLEYLELEYSHVSQHSKINFAWVVKLLLIGIIELGCTFSNDVSTTMIVKLKLIPL